MCEMVRTLPPRSKGLGFVARTRSQIHIQYKEHLFETPSSLGAGSIWLSVGVGISRSTFLVLTLGHGRQTSHLILSTQQ